MKETIYIKDYVSLPCEDATYGIAKAISDAKKHNAKRLEFEAGIYPLKSFSEFETDQTAHDAGAELKRTKDVCILLNGLENITVCGKTDENGAPATVFEGYNHLKLHELLPSILWVDGGKNITIENFKFRRNPEFASAGEVIAVENNKVTIKIFEGNPCYDGMGTHCMNKFTPDGDLDGESLSYGPGIPDEVFRLVGERLLAVNSERVASMVKNGDIVTFHQGAKTDFQCFFGNIENLTLKNLHTTNSNGFAHLAFNIRNLNIIDVKFKPEGNQYFTAPRDAFKLHKCSGNILVDGMYVEGVRMDGQNMHSNYIFPVEVISADTVRLFTRYSYLPIPEGSDMEIYSGDECSILKIKECIHEGAGEKDGNPGQFFKVTFEKDIPYTVAEDTLFLASAWEPDLYTCKNSHFKNVAGAGHLSRIDHMRISNCTYKNMMNAGILMGTEFPTHVEGGHVTDTVISDCEFDNCGRTARYDAVGCIGIKSAGLPGPFNKDITIKNCTFKNSPIGIDIHDASNVTVENCKFVEIEQKICTDFSTSEKIYIDLSE
ncbi:MAG: right-handed parallel beta-helix repeat-containing protein [Clostridia bacterium]|nr:right-handed parallel beta-helix repeat-containing protein [Clostridia bacterium]